MNFALMEIQTVKKKSIQPTTRRQFLAAAASTVAVPMILPASVFGQNAPSKQITMGCIGVRGMGGGNMKNFYKRANCRVVAVCDVNREGGGYISWNWMQGKEHKLGGREPARRLVDEHYAGQKGRGEYRGSLGRRLVDRVRRRPGVQR